jgi:hypothetical protein
VALRVRLKSTRIIYFADLGCASQVLPQAFVNGSAEVDNSSIQDDLAAKVQERLIIEVGQMHHVTVQPSVPAAAVQVRLLARLVQTSREEESYHQPPQGFGIHSMSSVSSQVTFGLALVLCICYMTREYFLRCRQPSSGEPKTRADEGGAVVNKGNHRQAETERSVEGKKQPQQQLTNGNVNATKNNGSGGGRRRGGRRGREQPS